MLISHRYKFIYLKTVKTAGTSIEAALEEYCLPEGHEPVPTSTPAIETEAGIIGARGKKFAPGSKWRNHMSAEDVRSQVDPEVWDGYFKFCNIRNPWEKTVSWFHFENPDMKKKPQGEIFAAFRAWLRDTKTPRGLDHRVYFIDGKPAVDDVIRYDNMADDFERICAVLGVKAREIPSLKTSERGKKKIPYQRYFDLATRTRVQNMYAKQITQYGWAFN